MKDIPPYIDPEKIVPIARGSTEAFKTGTWSNRRPVHDAKGITLLDGLPGREQHPEGFAKGVPG